MTSPIFLASPILFGILFHLLLVNGPTCSALSRANHAVEKSPGNSPITSRLYRYREEYLMTLFIGTPPVTFSAVIDTGSDRIWTRCQPSQDHGKKSSLIFDPRKSSSFLNKSCNTSPLECNGMQVYKDHLSIIYTMGEETLTFGDSKIPNVTFGCGKPNKKIYYDGIVGMGRGDLSLVSQLKERVFSYCLASSSDQSKGGILLTGSKASSAITKIATHGLTKIQTTPLLRNNIIKEYGSYYYVSLEGITVGETKLLVTRSDFTIKRNGNGGMIIDSGTLFTYFEKHIIDMITEAFITQTKLERINSRPWGLEHCFKSPNDIEIIPKLVFHFEGADWELPRENYMYKESGLVCLAMLNADDSDQLSVLGNMHQQNMMVLYDLDKNSLSFMPAKCNEL